MDESADQMSVDWNPAAYLRFRGLRMRPALDLLTAIPELPDGPIVDLGCGAGNIGPALAARFPGHALIGVDSSASMLEKAATEECYTMLQRVDVADWAPGNPPSLIFSNALLHWLPDHANLLPRLAASLAPGGTLAIQMPSQQQEPSHALLRRISGEMFPDRFDWTDWKSSVSKPEDYISLLSPLGELNLWETIYHQRLSPVEEGHPVRAFTASTVGRTITERLSLDETSDFFAAYDAALAWAYPAACDGVVTFPFRRLFMVLSRTP